MPALSKFTDFFNQTTGPAYFSPPDQVINDAQLRNYEALDMFTRTKRAVQGGESIKDMIFFDDPGTADTYQPGDPATITNVQGGTTISVDWRFARVPITWTEAEILLNGGGSNVSRTQQFHQFKNLRDFKTQQAQTSLMNKIERLLLASASNSKMEAQDGKDPYSIFASLTSDGLAPSGFTTVQGVNPTTQSKWRNQTASYNSATPFDTEKGIIAGFDEIAQKVQFKRPPSAQQYFESSQFRSMVIFTNKEGRRDYMKALRANNDITRAGPQDPAFGEPVFMNIPVKFAEGIDDQSIFTSGQPDFLFINGEYLKVIFHRDKWMQKSQPMQFADKPDTMVVWIDMYFNLFNASRQRHGYLQAN